MYHKSKVGPNRVGGGATTPLAPFLARLATAFAWWVSWWAWSAAMVGIGPNLSVGWAVFSFVVIGSALCFV